MADVTTKPTVTPREAYRIAADRVNRGAALLDEHEPGWEARIVPDDINLACTSFCILGQAFGTFSKGLEALPGLGRGENNSWRYGFDITTERQNDPVSWRELDACWVDLLTMRAIGAGNFLP